MILFERQIPSSFKEVDLCVREVLSLLSAEEALSDESLLFKVSFVLRELMNNAVEHGNSFDVKKHIECLVAFDMPILKIEISDEGKGFIINDAYYRALDNEKRERKRGLKLIEELNFEIQIDRSTIQLKLNVS